MKNNFSRVGGWMRWLGLVGLFGGSPVQARDYPIASRQEFEAALAAVRPGDSLVQGSGVWRDVWA